MVGALGVAGRGCVRLGTCAVRIWPGAMTYSTRAGKGRKGRAASGGGVGTGTRRPNGMHRGSGPHARRWSPTHGPKALPGPVEPTGGAQALAAPRTRRAATPEAKDSITGLRPSSWHRGAGIPCQKREPTAAADPPAEVNLQTFSPRAGGRARAFGNRHTTPKEDIMKSLAWVLWLG